MPVKDIAAKRLFFHFLQGALVGTGAILPGVSGGVLCVAFGIYEPMMALMAHPLRELRRNWRMFVPILCGGAVGFVLLAKLVEVFFSSHALLAMALFSGLICGTVPELFRKTTRDDAAKGWGAFIITLAFSFVFFQMLSRGTGGQIAPNFGWYVFCGIIWGLSMIVPGLSSSSILLFIGLYQPMAKGIGDLDISVLLPLGIGFVLTVVSLARLVTRLLDWHYGTFTKIILGFVLSSVLMILPTQFAGPFDILLGLTAFLVGFVFAHWMDALQIKSEQ